jgi:hypothetical protein
MPVVARCGWVLLGAAHKHPALRLMQLGLETLQSARHLAILLFAVSKQQADVACCNSILRWQVLGLAGRVV